MPNESSNKINMIIAGAGKAGQLISKDLMVGNESPFNIVGFVDDDATKVGKKVNGKPVLGPISKLAEYIQKYQVEEVLISIPSERGKTIRRVIECAAEEKVIYKILPRMSEVLLQDFKDDYLKYIRKVKAEDLLGSEILKSDQKGITKFTKNKTIFITGAAGSIGSELSRQIAAHKPKRIVFYDWWENGMFDLRNQLLESYSEDNLVFIIGDIKDRKRLDHAIAEYKPNTIFHAAAYKHVPLMEHNPSEAIKNNIVGTKFVAELAIKHKVEKFVLVSSDKAVNPTNIMGATKRAAEKILHILAESQNNTTFCAVRFGNVINSNGSAIPYFEKQIEKGGPVTVTHEEMTRYFMTIPEAVHLILQAWVIGENNDLFVLDMGESIKIYDLAKWLITLQGYRPEVDVKIEIVGLRPGEKLFEEILVKEEETKATGIKKVFRTKNYMSFDKLVYLNNLTQLTDSLDDECFNVSFLKQRLKGMISTYKPSK